MKALCLQGGGAKGAFQAGAIKALTEKGYHFDCVVGASVGSINAAMYALGKVDELYDLWKELDFADVLPLERKGEGENLTLRSIVQTAWDALWSGVDTSKIRAIIEKHVDEKALRSSKIRFGLVAVKTGGIKPVLCKMFIEDIPEGQLIDYIMASGALPFFKKVEIDGVRYMDGGILDNLPIEMLAEAGYTDVTAIRLGGDIRYEKGGKQMNITYIDPSEDVGNTINFSNLAITKSLNLGFFDVMRMLDGLYGKSYYIRPFGEWRLRWFLWKHRGFVRRALAALEVGVCKRFRESVAVLTVLLSELIGVKGQDLVSIWIAFAELIATQFSLHRWRIYKFEELLSETAKVADFMKDKQHNENAIKLMSVAKILFEELKND